MAGTAPPSPADDAGAAEADIAGIPASPGHPWDGKPCMKKSPASIANTATARAVPDAARVSRITRSPIEIAPPQPC